MNKRGLGRGLSALIAENESPEKKLASHAAGVSTLPINKVHAGKLQPRSFFNEDDLMELSESIRTNGVVQPIIVRKDSADTHEIVAGERRWRASKMAGLDIIPVIVMELDDKQALEIALVENIQRRDLVATEIARGYQKLIDDFGYTQESLSEVVGKSRSQVTNTLRLLALPEGVQTLLDHDEISTGHARALLGAENAEEVALQVVKRGLNVRQTEKLVKKSSSFPRQQARTRHKVEAEKDPDILEIEKLISGALGMDVDIQNTGDKGAVTIGYQSLVELDRLLRLLEQPLETEAQQEVVSA